MPPELPPIRPVNHEILVDTDSKLPHRGLYQLSTAELVEIKDHIVGFLKGGLIRANKSPYGASLFIVGHKRKFRGVVDNRDLNRITKRNNTPLPRSYGMFNRLEEALVFFKIDLKVFIRFESHQRTYRRQHSTQSTVN